MNKTTKIVVALLLVVVVASGAVLLMGKSDKDTTSKTSTDSSASSDNASAAAVITYDGTSFRSSTNTINAGDAVKVVNNSQESLAFDSNPHPVHTDNTELNVGDIGPGQSQTFTIGKKGTWGYHNHLNASQKGEITVK